MKKTVKIFLCLMLVIALNFTQACYQPKPVKTLKGAQEIAPRTLFLALDGVDYELISELKREGYFSDFAKPIPLVSTFPSDTTIGFTGIFWPLAVGQVPGYESRFFSREDNRIMGGTPLDIYKIDINYKNYFDNFRHTMQEKTVMYVTPGAAGKADLINTEKMLYENNKRVVFSYIGATDGSAHMLGRLRTKRFLVFMDNYIKRMMEKYRNKTGEDLRIVLLADHGFQYNRLKTIDLGDMKKAIAAKGYRFNSKIEDKKDVVAVKFGLLSAGVMFTDPQGREDVARAIATIDGVDIVTWRDERGRVHVLNQQGDEAVFEYRTLGKKLLTMRYKTITGDPLNYLPLLQDNKLTAGQWLSPQTWFQLSSHAYYPDAGYRLYDAYFRLIKNEADVIFGTKPNYQYGALVTRIATYPKFGQRGTHGGLFRQTSWTFAMETANHVEGEPPQALRYDQLFPYFLKPVTRHYQKEVVH